MTAGRASGISTSRVLAAMKLGGFVLLMDKDKWGLRRRHRGSAAHGKQLWTGISAIGWAFAPGVSRHGARDRWPQHNGVSAR